MTGVSCGEIPSLIMEDESIAVLDEIADPAVGLALWHRRLPPVLDTWLDQTPPARLPEGRLLVRTDDIEEALDTTFRAAAIPDDIPARLLRADVATLARRFARIAGSALVDLRLEALAHDACCRFHRDFVPLRLLCTYRGPGTQWIAPAQAGRAVHEQDRYKGEIRHMPRHAAALFKGEGHGQGHGIVHRSPPIKHIGTTRLLLCLNLPSTVSPKPWHELPADKRRRDLA